MVGTGSASRRPAICEIIMITILASGKQSQYFLSSEMENQKKHQSKLPSPLLHFSLQLCRADDNDDNEHNVENDESVESDDNYNYTHRFLDDYQQSWDAGQEHCKDWGAGQLCFVYLYFGNSVYL